MTFPKWTRVAHSGPEVRLCLETAICSSTMPYFFVLVPEPLDTNGHEVQAVFQKCLSDLVLLDSECQGIVGPS